MEFRSFAVAVNKKLQELSKNELFVVGTSEDPIFEHYLQAFPEGSNPIYKTRTWHDCSCCKNFVRSFGRTVAIKEDGTVDSVWNVSGLESPYKEVAESMHGYLSEMQVTGVFRTQERGYGAEFTRQLLEDGSVKRWEHFYGVTAQRFLTASPGEAKGTVETTARLFHRGLVELKPEALQQVLDLIDQNALYRGQEHRQAVAGFADKQREFLACRTKRAQMLFVWRNSGDMATRFRNTVIGTLVQDLSEGVDLERAVASFESKVAPTNYKRTTALITPKMVQSAMETIRSLGLEETLHRRLAKMSDLTVNNVLWVDRSEKKNLKGGIEDLLLGEAVSKNPVQNAKTIQIGVEEFVKKILPTAQSMEVQLRNQHLPNFVTVTAPVSPDTGKLFKWTNDFAWSYDGNITDSIRERVKKAGGNVDARVRFSLAWHNYDDLDIHVKTPQGEHIYFGNKIGILDVDMNVSSPVRNPVENLSFTKPHNGTYVLWVNQYNRRETTSYGFTVEIASDSGVQQFSYHKSIPTTKSILIGEITVENGAVTDIKLGDKDLVGSGIPQKKWSLKTESSVRVRTVLLSPNYWDENAVGNKHWFFVLEGCKVEEPMRGIYNEFLASGLEKHRKVFEVLGDKTRCPPTEEQLSGLGFSSTQDGSATFAVQSSTGTRLYQVNFKE